MQESVPQHVEVRGQEVAPAPKMRTVEEALKTFEDTFIDDFCKKTGSVVSDGVWTAAYLHGAEAHNPANNEDVVVKKAFSNLSTESKMKFMAVVEMVNRKQMNPFDARDGIVDMLFPSYKH